MKKIINPWKGMEGYNCFGCAPNNEAGVKMLAATYFLLRGIPFIYQGQEIGMENMEFTSMDQIDDISTIDEYQVALRAG